MGRNGGGSDGTDNPSKYLMDFCETPREGDEDFEYQLIQRGGSFCEKITLTAADGRDRDTDLLDCWAKDHVDANGTDGNYFSLDLAKSVRDPLYDEPLERVWNGPFQMKMWVRKPEKTTTAREEGLEGEFTAEIWIARAAVEAACVPRPKEGDIILFWDLPFYADFGSLNSSQISNAGWYYDVKNVKTDGHMTDGPHFEGFLLDVIRRTSHTPERKLYGDGSPQTH